MNLGGHLKYFFDTNDHSAPLKIGYIRKEGSIALKIWYSGSLSSFPNDTGLTRVYTKC